MLAIGLGLLVLAALLIAVGFWQWNAGVKLSADELRTRGATATKPDLGERIWKEMVKHWKVAVDPKSTPSQKRLNMGVALIQTGLLVLLVALVPLITAWFQSTGGGGGGGGGSSTSPPSGSATT